MNEKLRKTISEVIEKENYELVDAEYVFENGKNILRIYIDKNGGISHADCEYISERVGFMLDSDGIINESYFLEVSSPGLDRKLTKESDFKRFTGKEAKIKLKNPLNGQRNFSGTIAGLENRNVIISLNSEKIFIPFDDIAVARLKPEL